ncbi:S1C family serine protease [Lentibacillus juripiscarius]|uniref:S1C family serine protease n=1 Tax=Lentibacillus juripiscarius TaxID=257446 RepID=A0ABW5VAK3_9BACI
MKDGRDDRDIIDDDLYEDFDEEELYELVEQERQRALEKSLREKDNKPKRPFPKWVFWLIAAGMVLNTISMLPRTFSIPAIDFLLTSAELSTQDTIQSYKKSVVVIETDDGRGTGFSISDDGTILTNHHVVEGEDTVTVAFPEKGLFSGDVVETYPGTDLAVLEVEGSGLPHLDLAADKAWQQEDQQVYFIGNPIRFNGIANKGTVLKPITLDGWDKPVIMMDAPVYRGNSGSPVINQDGKVIGVVFATLRHDTYGRVGLFIPIDYYHKQS